MPLHRNVLAGYYTADGKYLGGVPEFHTISREIYQCTDFEYSEASNTTSDAVYCKAWSADEYFGGGFQLGTCECKSPATNGEFCFDWVCDQGDNEFTICQCDDEVESSEIGLFCESWSCKQISSGGRAEYESYNCQRSSPSGDYCEAWNGNVTASDEFEVVACDCIANWDGDQMCSFWECEELGLSTCSSARSSWCNLGVSVGVGGGIGFLGVLLICGVLCRKALMKPSTRADQWDDIVPVLIGVLWCMVSAVGVVIWGGQDGAAYVGIMWGLPIVVASVVPCRAVFLRHTKDEQSLGR
eukprot:g17648.t2